MKLHSGTKVSDSKLDLLPNKHISEEEKKS